jgi:transcriptional regulator with XRE-family HTH domain
MPEVSSPDLAQTYGLDSKDDVREVQALVVVTELVDQLARRRTLSGLTQAQVAARMGTNQSAVAKMESHRHDPRLSTLARYVAAIELDTHEVAVLLDEIASTGDAQGQAGHWSVAAPDVAGAVTSNFNEFDARAVIADFTKMAGEAADQYFSAIARIQEASLEAVTRAKAGLSDAAGMVQSDLPSVEEISSAYLDFVKELISNQKSFTERMALIEHAAFARAS